MTLAAPTVDPLDVLELEGQLRSLAGVATRVEAEHVVLVPGSARDAARALAARERLGRLPDQFERALPTHDVHELVDEGTGHSS